MVVNTRQDNTNEMTTTTDMIKCIFCDTEEEYGNNPEPFCVDAGERCCNFCNAEIVIPIRMRVLQHNKNKETGYGTVKIRNQHTGVLEKTLTYGFGDIQALSEAVERECERRERGEKLQEERKVRDEEECKKRAADFEKRISALEVKEAQRKEEEKREKEEKVRKAQAKREETLKKQEAKQAKWKKQ